MPDYRIYDAIFLFKQSATGQGTGDIGGDDAYRARYRTLARNVVEELWSLWTRDDISFHNLGHLVFGDSARDPVGPDIRVNTQIEPSNNPTLYQNSRNQGKLAATSCNLVHEATHLVRPRASYPEEEVLCRTIQVLYFDELTSARSYESRFANALCTAQYRSTTPFFQDLQARSDLYLCRCLIDNVLDIEEYRNGPRGLESDATADFIKRSLTWWEGLSARWPSTRGYYLRSLASRSGRNYADEILMILESLTPALWPAAKRCAGDLSRIRRALVGGLQNLHAGFRHRIIQVEVALGESFGIRTP